MRQALARPKHSTPPNNLIVFINRALREAALSDRPNDAIDTLAAALVTLAALARMEGRPHA